MSISKRDLKVAGGCAVGFAIIVLAFLLGQSRSVQVVAGPVSSPPSPTAAPAPMHHAEPTPSREAPGSRSYAKKAPSGNLQTDLLSELCAVGATCRTGVMLPPGYELKGTIKFDDGRTAGSPSSFALVTVTQTPADAGVWLDVTATNKGTKPAPITAMLEYGPAAPSASLKKK